VTFGIAVAAKDVDEALAGAAHVRGYCRVVASSSAGDFSSENV
jgi:hypothetical protein